MEDIALNLLKEYGPWAIGWITTGWLLWERRQREKLYREDMNKGADRLADVTRAMNSTTVALNGVKDVLLLTHQSKVS